MKRRTITIAVDVIALAALAVVGWVVFNSVGRSRDVAVRNACIQNLVIIEGAKQKLALTTALRSDDKITPEQLEPYLAVGGGWRALACGRHGRYTPNSVGEDATCSIPGHAIAKP